MNFPVALVMAVFVWCSAKYIPPYFLESRKMDLLEERLAMDNARQVALLRQIRSELQARTAAEAAEGAERKYHKRFY